MPKEYDKDKDKKNTGDAMNGETPKSSSSASSSAAFDVKTAKDKAGESTGAGKPITHQSKKHAELKAQIKESKIFGESAVAGLEEIIGDYTKEKRKMAVVYLAGRRDVAKEDAKIVAEQLKRKLENETQIEFEISFIAYETVGGYPRVGGKLDEEGVDALKSSYDQIIFMLFSIDRPVSWETPELVHNQRLEKTQEKIPHHDQSHFALVITDFITSEHPHGKINIDNVPFKDSSSVKVHKLLLMGEQRPVIDAQSVTESLQQDSSFLDELAKEIAESAKAQTITVETREQQKPKI